MELEGRKALIFGGTSGIGEAAAHLLAQKGALVTSVSRNPDRAGTMPEGIAVEKCNVLDEGTLKELFSRHAPFDILISTATGGERELGPFASMSMAGFQGSFDKLFGYANVVRHGLEHLNEKGSVVLVSGSPARRCRPGQVALSAVGGAVEAFVRGLAPELAPRRINVVSPGVIDTPMQTATGPERNALYAGMTRNHLISRPGTAREAAEAILFLVQNEFVTGTTIDVDGGWLLS